MIRQRKRTLGRFKCTHNFQSMVIDKQTHVVYERCAGGWSTFVECSRRNQLHLNVDKPNEMLVDLGGGELRLNL